MLKFNELSAPTDERLCDADLTFTSVRAGGGYAPKNMNTNGWSSLAHPFCFRRIAEATV